MPYSQLILLQDLRPKSGYELYRDRNTPKVLSEGYSGRAIASQIGERWRSLSAEEKLNFGFQAFTVCELKKSPQMLERTESVFKSGNRVTVDKLDSPRRMSF